MRSLATQPKIELDRVSLHYPTCRGPLAVLEGIDLFAREGEFVTIIGPSGCGKSTLLNVIAGLEEPSTGTIRIDGRPATRRIGSVAYMHQKDLLMPWRTILDNTILGLEIQGVSKPEARKKALALFDQFGLTSFENAYPATLSGGMRQRAAFLRTILTNREVMLLDEPFGALDALTRSEMQEWLLHLWDSLRKTILFVTHDVDEAVLLSDRVYVMTARPGKVKLAQEIGLPRPREYGMVTSTRFVAIKELLLSAIREETRGAIPEDPHLSTTGNDHRSAVATLPQRDQGED
ncbi:MAG TPA: ABC transporter ATP-binding protein [Chloroflexota bacterium]|nr:ABC transporter ATP-binding protein [Chloroflexota bacterium]